MAWAPAGMMSVEQKAVKHSANELRERYYFAGMAVEHISAGGGATDRAMLLN